MSFENMIIMGKASQKLTAGGYLKNDGTDIRSAVLQDNVSPPRRVNIIQRALGGSRGRQQSASNVSSIMALVYDGCPANNVRKCTG